jgi:hypothetical protein
MTAGPVLIEDELGRAIVAALRELNSGLEVVEHGSYLRARAPGGLRLTRAVVERHLGRPFQLPADLERAMTSYEGQLSVDEDEARWTTGPTR